MKRHLVGQVTDFGLLLGDTIKSDIALLSPARYERLDYVTTVAWYRNLDDNTYLIIEWAVYRDGTSTEISRDRYDTSIEAWRIYLVRAFGVMM